MNCGEYILKKSKPPKSVAPPDADVALLLDFAAANDLLVSVSTKEIKPEIRGTRGVIFVRDEGTQTLAFEYERDFSPAEVGQLRRKLGKLVYDNTFNQCWEFDRSNSAHVAIAFELCGLTPYGTSATRNAATADAITKARQRKLLQSGYREQELRAQCAANGTEYYPIDERESAPEALRVGFKVRMRTSL